MKMKLLTAALLMIAPFATAASGPLKEKATEVFSAKKDSVLYLSVVVEIEMTAGDAPSRTSEQKLEIMGTVIGSDGLIVAPLSTLDPASAMDGRMVNGPQGPVALSAKSTTKEVKIVMPDGSEVDAKVVFKDPDLDLAFIRPEDAEGVKFTHVDIADSAELTTLDDVIILSRLEKELNRQATVNTAEVVAMITKPRTFAKVSSSVVGKPVFNAEGKFAGLGINRFSAKNSESSQGPRPMSVVLPAADLAEAAANAK
jgi:hypothetical protein